MEPPQAKPKKDPRQRLCMYWTENSCRYDKESCWHVHGEPQDLIGETPFESYRFYSVKKALDGQTTIHWYIKEGEKMSTIVFLDNAVKENEKKIKEILAEIEEQEKNDNETAIERCVSDIQLETGASPSYGTKTLESRYKISDFNSTSSKTAKVRKEGVVPKYWKVTSGSKEVKRIENDEQKQPVLDIPSLPISRIDVPKNSKPVSGLEASCSTKLFAKNILDAETDSPHFVCSGSTLSQILNWLMKLRYNWDRKLICFQKMSNSTTIWAHCLYPDPNQVPTTQPKQAMNFSTAVENLFLRNTTEGEYVYASTLIPFRRLKLLTYFEVDGFNKKGKPVEIKSQKFMKGFLQRSAVSSVQNSLVFTVKDEILYFQYKKASLIEESYYDIDEAVVSTKPLGDIINNEKAITGLHKILTDVQKALNEEQTYAVVLKLRPDDLTIDFVKIEQNGGATTSEIWIEAKEEPKKSTSSTNIFDLLAEK